MLDALVANLLHGLVGLVWIASIRRFSGPLSALVHARLLAAALLLPALAAGLHTLGVGILPESLRLVRVARLEVWFLQLDPALRWLGGGLLAGVAALFAIQELPSLAQRRQQERRPDERLERTLETVTRSFAEQLGPRWGRPTRIHALLGQEPTAELRGLFDPEIVVSEGLLDQLDDQELEAVLAHELAHRVLGGNSRLLLIWLARAAQAFNPSSLVLFRTLVEVREAACDELAARVTGRPAALAQALLKAYGGGPRAPGAGGPAVRARYEVLRRAERASTRSRVERLLDPSQPSLRSRAHTVLLVALLALLTWGIQ